VYAPKQQGAPAAPVVDPKDQAAISTIMKNNPGISQQDAAAALADYKSKKAGQ